MSAGNYKLPTLEEDIARTYRDRIGNIPRLLLPLRRVTIYNHLGDLDEEFIDFVRDAREQGILNEQEWREFWDTHVVLRGEDKEDGLPSYATIDIAIIVEECHINKAVVRADILRRVTGERTIPAVVGAFVSDDSLHLLARDKGVTLVHRGLDNAKIYRFIKKDMLEQMYGDKIKLIETGQEME